MSSLRLSDSPLFVIKHTLESGRGIYANVPITKDTLLFETSSIVASVIYREYRKEVCAQCFAYDRGRQWKLRDSELAIVFCSTECRDEWTITSTDHGDIIVKAIRALEARAKISHFGSLHYDAEESVKPRPTVDEISAAWQRAKKSGYRIRAARLSKHPSKLERRATSQALSLVVDRDTSVYLLSCILCCVCEPRLWAEFLELTADPVPYSSPAMLEQHITSFYHLLACCPADLLPNTNVETLLTFAQKSVHNVFNIWSQEYIQENIGSSGSLGGNECLGMAVWPEASYWNHSCAPNVRKTRIGRKWQFWAHRDILEGEEMCITYLGGDEREMTRDQRQLKLKQLWSFECACVRCRAGD